MARLCTLATFTFICFVCQSSLACTSNSTNEESGGSGSTEKDDDCTGTTSPTTTTPPDPSFTRTKSPTPSATQQPLIALEGHTTLQTSDEFTPANVDELLRLFQLAVASQYGPLRTENILVKHVFRGPDQITSLIIDFNVLVPEGVNPEQLRQYLSSVFERGSVAAAFPAEHSVKLTPVQWVDDATAAPAPTHPARGSSDSRTTKTLAYVIVGFAGVAAIALLAAISKLISQRRRRYPPAHPTVLHPETFTKIKMGGDIEKQQSQPIALDISPHITPERKSRSSRSRSRAGLTRSEVEVEPIHIVDDGFPRDSVRDKIARRVIEQGGTHGQLPKLRTGALLEIKTGTTRSSPVLSPPVDVARPVSPMPKDEPILSAGPSNRVPVQDGPRSRTPVIPTEASPVCPSNCIPENRVPCERPRCTTPTVLASLS